MKRPLSAENFVQGCVSEGQSDCREEDVLDIMEWICLEINEAVGITQDRHRCDNFLLVSRGC